MAKAARQRRGNTGGGAGAAHASSTASSRARFAAAALAAAFGAIGLTAALSAAFACVPVASVQVNPAAAHPGDTVKATAKGFPANSAVEVHLRNAEGEKLGEATADETGTAEVTFSMPSVPPAYYTVVAFVPGRSGEPARAVISVPGAPAVAPPVAAVVSPNSSSGSGGSVLTLLLITLLGLGGIGLSVAGIAVVIASRQRTARTRAYS